jgi:hypothetical protein
MLVGQRKESGTLLELLVERWTVLGLDDVSCAGLGGCFLFEGGILTEISRWSGRRGSSGRC